MYAHSGTVYKCDNWEFDGEVDSSYWYVSRRRSIIHKKTVWNKAKRHNITEKEQADKDKLKKVKSMKKKRWVYRL